MVNVRSDSRPIQVSSDFGCIHWESKDGPVIHGNAEKFAILSAHIEANYQPSSTEERKIDDLQSECDRAAGKIKRLSAALVDLGYDPTTI